MFFPEDISKVGSWVDNLFYLALILTGVTFLLVVAILVYFMIRYRARKGQKGYYTHGKSPKALLLTLFLAALVFIVIDVNLAVHDHYAWEAVWGKPVPPDALKVEIMPEQFAWNIRYAGKDHLFKTEDDIVTINELHVPVDRTIVVSLKSKDVIHSFFLPNFRIKQDVVPGLVTMINFEAAKTGVFDIACAEHCGLGHYRMRGILTVESEEDFQNWLTKNLENNSPDDSWGWAWGR